MIILQKILDFVYHLNEVSDRYDIQVLDNGLAIEDYVLTDACLLTLNLAQY